jgi:ribosomal protein L40E
MKKEKEEKKDIVEIICPRCGTDAGIDKLAQKCRLCGSYKTINQVSGNEIWMCNGSIVSAFKDEYTAYAVMAEKYDIPKNQWPKRFLTSEVN